LKFSQIILTDILSRKNNQRIVVRLELSETVRQCVDDGFCTQIRATNADDHNHLAQLSHFLCSSLDIGNLGSRNRRWQVHPAKKIVAFASLLVKCGNILFNSIFVGQNVGFADETERF